MIFRNSIHAPIMKKRLSIEEINSRIIDEDFELVSTEYVNAHQKLDWHCKSCDNIFQSSWLNISSGWGCSFCKSIETSKRIKEMRRLRGDGISKSDAMDLLQKHGLEFVSIPADHIDNLGQKTYLRCVICETEFIGRLQDVKKKVGYGCWECSRRKGERSHFWKGGCEKDYPKEWTNSLREYIRDRDNRQCQFPECVYSDTMYSIRLHVHHINGYKDDCSHKNLISLCNKHHMFVESNSPKNWEDYFYSITADYEYE